MSSTASEKTVKPSSVKQSKQLHYYYKKTDGLKRRNTPFSEQSKPSKQLKYYHRWKREQSIVMPVSSSESETEERYDASFEQPSDLRSSQSETNERYDVSFEPQNVDQDLIGQGATALDHEDKNSIDSDIWDSSSSSDTSNPTSESSDTEQSGSTDTFISSSSEEISDADSDGENCDHENNINRHETSSTMPEVILRNAEGDEQFYPGSPLSVFLVSILIITFVFKHKLTKSAWGDLLKLISALIPNMNKALSSVHTIKVLIGKIFDCINPIEIKYCSRCLNAVAGEHCQDKGCRKAKVNTFLDLRPEEKLKQLFSDVKFLELLAKGKKESFSSLNNFNMYETYMMGLNTENF